MITHCSSTQSFTSYYSAQNLTPVKSVASEEEMEWSGKKCLGLGKMIISERPRKKQGDRFIAKRHAKGEAAAYLDIKKAIFN